MARIKKPLVMSALAMVAGVFLFQNCSGGLVFSGQSSAVSQAPQGGAGADGMIARAYQSLKTCPDGSVGVADEIKVAKDGSSASMTMRDCAPVTPPTHVDLASLNYTGDDKTVFVYSGAIFDERTDAASQRVTTNVCTGSAMIYAAGGGSVSKKLKAQTWLKSSDANQLLGSVVLEDGSTTGDLAIAPVAPFTLASQAGAMNGSMLLRLATDVTPATLDFSIPSLVTGATGGLQCVHQPLPKAQITYSWVGTGWAPCSLGTQTMTYACLDNQALPASESSCPTPKPSESQACPLLSAKFSVPTVQGQPLSWTVPLLVTRVRVFVIGGGGGSDTGGGGGSGGEAVGTIQVLPGQTFSIDVGGGGSANPAGPPVPAGISRLTFGGILLQGYGGGNATATAPGSPGVGNTSGGSALSNSSSFMGHAGSSTSGGAPPDPNLGPFGAGGDPGVANNSGKPGVVLITY